ncbi:MAG: hypothetical protein ABH885_08480 [Candidatus Omnitrophota bacterium]
MTKERLDFEISFFEDVVKDRPGYFEALAALGNAYTKKGRYTDGLEIDMKLLRIKPDDPVVHYNLACSYSLLGDADRSLEALKKSVRFGYKDFDYMERDPDLDFVRKDPRYPEEIIKNKKIIS